MAFASRVSWLSPSKHRKPRDGQRLWHFLCEQGLHILRCLLHRFITASSAWYKGDLSI